jgi:HEAT repeat protein
MPSENNTVDNLIAKLKDKNPKVRAEGWLSASKVGAPAIKPLAAVTTSGDSDLEVARSAKRALWQIVHGFGLIHDEAQRKAVLNEFQSLLTDEWPDVFRREVLWMLSEIGDDSSVEPIKGMMKIRRLIDDARCALQRIPGEESLVALQDALNSVPNGYKNNIAHALRARGVQSGLEKYPEENLIPTTPTNVKPEGKKTP